MKGTNKLEVKDYIINGADNLFCQYGFKSVTMDDIAKQLGVSKKTIYQHFKDKNELINILIRDRIVNQDLQMNKCIIESENAVQEVYFGMQDLDFFLETMNPILFYDLQKYHQEAWLNFMDFKEKEIGRKVMDNLKRGIREGLYRQELDVEIITKMRLGQVDMIFTQNRYYDTKKNSLAQIMVEITRHFLYGICNNEGIKLIHKYEKEFFKEKSINQ